MNKTIYFIANWKMNGNTKSFKEIMYVYKFLKINFTKKLKKVIFAPPLHLLYHFRNKINSSILSFASQDVSFISKKEGAFTGQISANMLKNDCRIEYVIIGHSEKRLIDENYLVIKSKIINALNHNLKVIFCIGENLSIKKKGMSYKFLVNQISKSLDSKMNLNNILIAYEPIWSIGTGMVPSVDYLNFIYNKLNVFFKKKYKFNSPKMLYGGSVDSKNITSFKNVNFLSGFLIGGASLNGKSFKNIIKNYFN